MFVDEARALMRSRAQLGRTGLSGTTITARVRAGILHRVDRGWYLDRADWDALYAEKRHLLRVVAAHDRRPAGSTLVYSHFSAAVLWRLPLFRVEPRRVHVSGARANGHVRGGDPLIARHEVAVSDEQIVWIEGIACTSLARTVADTLRIVSEESGIALADAALRLVAWDDAMHTYDRAAAAAFRAHVHALLPRGGRGVRLARSVIDFADGRADRPGESVSRLYLREIGFGSPRLQVPVPGPVSGNYYLDFGLDDADAWGEYDGRGKYTDPAMLGGRDPAQVLLEEKRREDWIRATTNRRFARWEYRHVASPAALRARLASFHIHPPHP